LTLRYSFPVINSPLLASSLKKTEGDVWKISILHDEFHHECKWAEFVSSTGKSAGMCVHDFDDVVSLSIINNHRWLDCDILTELWNEGQHTDKSIYVDIGANIGSCVMEMLLSTNASIVAFEPHPKNLFCFGATLSKLDQSLQDRVVIVPIALGASRGSSTLYSAQGNMGNSVVGTVVQDFSAQQFLKSDQRTIQIERMDSILSSSVDIPLMKIDAQGFECYILEGLGQELADRIHVLHFEFATQWLDAQNCTDFLDRIRRFGFDIFSKDGSLLSDVPNGNEVVARKRTSV